MTSISERAWEGALGDKEEGDTERGHWGIRGKGTLRGVSGEKGIYWTDKQKEAKNRKSMVWALRGLQDPEENQTSCVKVEVMPF